MIITKPFICQKLECLGFINHHTAIHCGYRRKHYKGNIKSPFVFGYLCPYSGRFGVGFILHHSSDSIYQNHKITYFIRKAS